MKAFPVNGVGGVTSTVSVPVDGVSSASTTTHCSTGLSLYEVVVVKEVGATIVPLVDEKLTCVPPGGGPCTTLPELSEKTPAISKHTSPGATGVVELIKMLSLAIKISAV